MCKKRIKGRRTSIGRIKPGELCVVDVKMDQYEIFIRTDCPRSGMDCEFVGFKNGQMYYFAFDMECFRINKEELQIFG